MLTILFEIGVSNKNKIIIAAMNELTSELSTSTPKLKEK